MHKSEHRRCIDCHQNKCLFEFARDKHRRDGVQSRCKACHAAKGRKWRAANPGKATSYVRRYMERHPEKAKEVRVHAEAKRKASGYFERWYRENLETKRAKNRQWSKLNPAANAALRARGRAALQQRTVGWADYEAIRRVYAEARRLTEETGIRHEVDHIIPLRGKCVSGLHVHYNLRVIPMTDNRKKHAKFDAAKPLAFAD
jgi:hypothetical protein